MAVRFDTSTDRLLRTTDLLDYNAAYTWMAWVRIVQDQGDYSAFWSLNRDNSSNLDYVGTSSDGTTLLAVVEATEVTGTNLTVGTWYHIAGVRVTTTSFLIYLNGVQNISNTGNNGGRGAAIRMEMGGDFTTNADAFNGRVAAVKAWSTNLSAAEILAEMNYWKPVRTANLYGDWRTFPGAVERLADYSGNGRNWTAGGALTDEDPPPLIWTVPIWLATPPAVAAGGAVGVGLLESLRMNRLSLVN